MTEEEIRIIVDRVFTELRNNSKTIAQLSEKTEVDNCWFEIDNGFKISLSTLKKYIAGTESINITDLSDLDNYKLTTHRGVFNVYRGNILVGVLFIIQYQAPQHGGLQVFLSTFDYKMSGSSSLKMPSIIYRSTDYNNYQKWLEWKPYQTTFISNDGSVPENGAGIGLNDTNMSPSLNLFLKLSSYPKIVKWSGIVIETGIIQPGNSSTSSYNNIKFVKSAGCFAYDDRGTLYRSWYGSSDYYVSGALTKNIFVDMQNNVWIADSASTIKQISSSSSNSAQYCDVAKWSGKILDDDTASYIVDNTDLSSTGLNDPSKIVFKPLINSFLYHRAGEEYYNRWDNFEDFQAFVYPAENQPPFGEFNPGLKANVFPGTDGSYWIADSEKTIKLIGNTLDIIDGEYDPSFPSNFQPVADKILASPNFMARISYRSSATSDDIIFFRGCLPEKAYDFSSLFPLTLVGTGISGNTYLMMRYDKEIEIVCQKRTEIYQLPGDITKGFVNSNYDEVLGPYPAFKAAFDAGKIFVSKGTYLKVERRQGDGEHSYNITFSYYPYSNGSLRYAYIYMTANGSQWTDDPTNDTFSIKGTIV